MLKDRLIVIFWLVCGLLASPAHAEVWYRNWSVKPAWPEVYSLTIGTGLTLTTLAFRKTMVDDFQNFETTHKPLGKFSKYGDWAGQLVPNVLYAGGMILASYHEVPRAGTRAQLMITATTEAVLITTVLKYAIREKRPDSGQRTSFPSGHTTSAFAFASIVGAEHGWRWGVPAYALATYVGWSRINDNQHFLQDVLAGATIGMSTGLGVYYRHRHEHPGGESSWNLLPWPMQEGGGALLQASW
jgi:membrane-associated phospholipid phosphatase